MWGYCVRKGLDAKYVCLSFEVNYVLDLPFCYTVKTVAILPGYV